MAEHTPPGTGMWHLEERDLPAIEATLIASGLDVNAPSLLSALVGLRPATLSEGALDMLSDNQRVTYEFEQAVLKEAGYAPLPPLRLP